MDFAIAATDRRAPGLGDIRSVRGMNIALPVVQIARGLAREVMPSLVEMEHVALAVAYHDQNWESIRKLPLSAGFYSFERERGDWILGLTCHVASIPDGSRTSIPSILLQLRRAIACYRLRSVVPPGRKDQRGTREQDRKTAEGPIMSVRVCLLFAATLLAAVIPAGAQSADHALHMRLLAHVPMNSGGEGMAEVRTPNGRRILYAGHEAPPKCFMVVDVTDASAPQMIEDTDAPPGVNCNSLDVAGNTLLVAHETEKEGEPGAGIRVAWVPFTDRWPREQCR